MLSQHKVEEQIRSALRHGDPNGLSFETLSAALPELPEAVLHGTVHEMNNSGAVEMVKGQSGGRRFFRLKTK